MVFSLAPKASSASRPQRSSTAVSTMEMPICSVKQPPSVFSALSISLRPMKIDARGAPPEAVKHAKADTIRMIGRHTPTPVSARLPTSGMWPM